jgi:DNA-binding transcriptional LysR family regulator
MLDTRRLKLFCVVAETGSITAAAARVHLTQPAISQQIALLEREIGAALIERLPRGIRLTEPGRLLAERGRAILRELSALEEQVRVSATERMQIRLGVFSTAGANLVPRLVQAYRFEAPQIRLVLHASQPEALEAELHEGLIDVGLSWDYDFLPRAFANLHRRHLLDDPMLLLAPKGHALATSAGPLHLAALAGETWVVRTHRAPPYDFAFETLCRDCGFEPDISFRTDDYQSAQGLVAAGVGLCLVPRLALSALRPDVVALPLDSPHVVRRIEAVTLRTSATLPHITQLLDTLQRLWASPEALASH